MCCSSGPLRPPRARRAQGAYLTIGGRDYLNFCSSHYLGFAEEPRLKRAAQVSGGGRRGRPDGTTYEIPRTRHHHQQPLATIAHGTCPASPPRQGSVAAVGG
jgi:7-keto-8-aminopelargonate synthetase-like enzyme